MPRARRAKEIAAERIATSGTKKQQAAKIISRLLSIGLDFGTTNSGVAYGLVGNRNLSGSVMVDVILGWASHRKIKSERESEKVPSRLHYDDRGNTTWGHNIPKDARILQWFKLLLPKEEELPEYLRNSAHLKEAREMLRQLGVDAITVTSAYLYVVKLLWEHSIEAMKSSKGPDFVEEATFQVFFTVPAIWSETARKNVAEAVKKAGILDDRQPSKNRNITPGKTTIKYISEPEAAAICVLDSQLSYRPDLEKGDKFMVVDCGGGTVDIICYEVVEPAPNLKIKECTKGTGDLCGATFLDQAFCKYLVDTVGEREWNSLSRRQQMDIIQETWEDNIKPDFDPAIQEAGAWPVNIPGQQESIYLSSAEIRDVFQDSVVGRIQELVGRQIKKMILQRDNGSDAVTPKFVILVGGFGQCKYLRLAVRETLQENDGRIQLLQPQMNEHSWSAICRGAAISGIQRKSLVVGRKARHSYGFATDEPWDDQKHTENEDPEAFDTERGMRMARDRINWIVRAGDDVSTQPKPRPYDLAWSMDQSGPAEYQADVYKSPSSDPPTRLDEMDDPNRQKVGEIDMNFPVRIEDIKPRNNREGNPYRLLEYESLIDIDGNSFNFRSQYRGDVVGGFTVTSDTQDNSDGGLFMD
ncbi:hypothetical protein PG996_006066 [Apiospora saccharicola]|uniref:Actin-like ATPase domain-containing protein n=1 Tax=Apiospora saccharicola TaxID=335842 RepID=A0ABR1VN87_9PEZI